MVHPEASAGKSSDLYRSPVPCRTESPMSPPRASAPRPPRQPESQLEEALVRLTEVCRAASRCPMCLHAHSVKPTGCLALAQRRHAALCTHLLATHAGGCRLVAMQHYVATLADRLRDAPRV